jgi:hypothetical protein
VPKPNGCSAPRRRGLHGNRHAGVDCVDAPPQEDTAINAPATFAAATTAPANRGVEPTGGPLSEGNGRAFWQVYRELLGP